MMSYAGLFILIRPYSFASYTRSQTFILLIGRMFRMFNCGVAGAVFVW